MANDPGTGGININGQLYAYDVGVPDDEGGAQGPWSSGDVKSDKTTKDLSLPTRKTLADYLSKTTKAEIGSAAVPNRYTVDGQYAAVAITNDKGYPTKGQPSSNSQQFAPNLPSTYTPAAADLPLKRGKAVGNDIDGNDLLSNLPNKTSPVPNYQSAVLSQNRWYSPNNPLTDVPVLKAGFEPGSSINQTDVTFGRLATIGPTLMSRAGLELGSTAPGFDPNSTGAEANALLPGAAQAAIRKVDQALLTAADVLKNLTTNEENNEINIMSSWGALNNPNDQFAGLSAIGMIALSTALVASLQVAIEALYVVFGTGQTPSAAPAKDSQGRYALGSYFYGNRAKDRTTFLGAINAVASLDLGTLLGIYPTNFPFIDALKKGSTAFFGIDDTSTFGIELTTGAARMAENPGFNAVVARSIIRSADTIIQKTKDIKGNVVDVAKQSFSLIDVLKSSKIIAACNVFAQLGDALLTMPATVIDNDSIGGARLIDTTADSAYSAVAKNRLKNSIKLAWSGDRTNTMLLLPSNIADVNAAAKGLGVFNKTLSFGGEKSLITTTPVDTGRIDQDVVDAQEKLLNAEYVPFYFHDIRTNEIISFHAFLSSLTDDFTPNYEGTSGYGRVEQIKIYKDTARTINFSFLVAATSFEDFDAMWTKINKLITLVYPQYTAGKLITNGTSYTIRQPFTQMIGASPFIRLRIGDVIRSNYSRYNLARLFGLGDQNFELNNTFLQTNALDDTIAQNLSNRLTIAFNAPVGLTFIPAENFYPEYQDTTGVVPTSLPVPSLGGPLGSMISSAVTSNTNPKAHKFKQDGTNFMVKIIQKLDDNTVVGEVALNEDLPAEVLQRLSNDKIGVDADNIEKNFIGGRYVFTIDSLKPTTKTDQKMYDKLIKPNVGTFSNELNDFMSLDVNTGNVIARSFRSTGGKGLAGYIQNLNFDWTDNVVWETAAQYTAPKICKITISFAPIHDISPGLDAQGYNRAPVYPVGSSGPSGENT